MYLAIRWRANAPKDGLRPIACSTTQFQEIENRTHRRGLRHYFDSSTIEINIGIRVYKTNRGWDLTVFNSQYGLHDPCETA